jgi:hypothetical protein
MGGVGWQLFVPCVQKEGGTIVGLYAGPVPSDMPDSMYYRFRYTVSWGGGGVEAHSEQSLPQRLQSSGPVQLLQVAAHGGRRLG